MPKKKVSLFFHTEIEEEKKAYELLVSLGRRKSVTIADLIITHAEEIGQIWENKYTSSHVDHSEKTKKCDNSETVHLNKVEDKKNMQPKTAPAVVNANKGSADEMKEVVHDTVPVENSESDNKYDNSLIMKGLKMFGI